jgi:hypothetical protein
MCESTCSGGEQKEIKVQNARQRIMIAKKSPEIFDVNRFI